MISITTIFISSSDISNKAEINRAMQENIKNVIETIAEDIRQNGIESVTNEALSCDLPIINWKFFEWNKLCTPSHNYYLYKNGTFAEVSDCNQIDDKCSIYKYPIWELTNSMVSVKDLKFYLSKDKVPKVTINMTLQPVTGKGIRADLIKENKLIFQTTISSESF